jgi:hypothetical protein
MRTAWRAALALLATGYLVVMLVTGARPTREQFVAFEAAGVMTQTPEHVRGVELRDGARTWQIERRDDGWYLDDAALASGVAGRLSLALKFLHTARPVRTLDAADSATADAEYGLAAASPRVRVTLEDGESLALEFGGVTPDGSLQYLRVQPPLRIHLMSNFVGEEWRAVVAALP